MFADDTCLYVKVGKEDEEVKSAADFLNDDLASVSAWANQWLITFNASKTKTMVLSNKNIVHPDLTFNGTVLENISSHKHLGITFTSKLKWTIHIDQMLESASRMLDVSFKLQHRLDRKSLETIYLSFIRPKLEYGSLIWDDCNTREKERLENFQLRAARMVTGAKKGTSHVSLHNELNWEKLSNRRKNVKLLFMHKLVNEDVPSYLFELLPGKVGENVNVKTRATGNIKQINCKSVKYSKTIIPDCIDMWHLLDDDVKSIVDFDTFKNSVIESRKRDELYNFGDRKWNIIHAQLRLKSSNLNAHLVALHVLDEPMCSCGLDVEDNSHFFFMCPLYNNERQILFNEVNLLCDVSLDTLLFGNVELR